MIQLQYRRFRDGGQPYREAYSRPGEWDTDRYTLYLGLGSLVIAVVLGTGLAWAASALPPAVSLAQGGPDPPDHPAAVAAVLGWSFLLSPVPGYLNQALRRLPWWSDRFEGPFDIYTMPWIIIITGLSLAAFVYLFVSAGLENISDELIEAAQVDGSSRAGVFFRVILPLLRPALVYGGGRRAAARPRAVHRAAAARANQGVTRAHDGHVLPDDSRPPEYGLAAAIGSPLLLFGILVLFVNRILLGNHSRFITHGGKGGFRRALRGSWLAATSLVIYTVFATVLPTPGARRRLAVTILERRDRPEHLDARCVPPGDPRAADHVGDLEQHQPLDRRRRDRAPVGYIAAFFLRRGRDHRISSPLLDFVIAMPLSIPAVIFGVGFLLVYTNKPLVLYGTKWVIVLVYITLMIPFATRMLLAGHGGARRRVHRGGPRVRRRSDQDAAADPGPADARTFGGAAALMFVLLSHEFAASLLVRGARRQVMGTILYDYYENGGYPLVACISLIMVGVTGAGVAVAVLLGGSDAFKRL